MSSLGHTLPRRAFIGAATVGLLHPAIAFAQSDAPSGFVHPRFASASAKFRERAWAELAAELASLPPQSASRLSRDLAEIAGDLAEHPMGHTLLADFALDWAWRFRGTGLGNTITPEGLRGFSEQLAVAREHATRAIEMDPDDGLAHALGFRVCMGQSDLLGLLSGFRPYAMAARRPVSGLGAFGTAISAKWLGSEEMCIDFARQTYGLDAPASCGIIPEMLYVSFGARILARRAAAGLESMAAYFNDPVARNDILTADETYWSVAPDPDPLANWYANSWFAYALSLMSERDRARRHFLAMGNYVGAPWSDMENPRAALEGVRRSLGLEAL